MKLPAITSKQQELLELLYRYRFANSIQIQTLMHHKDRRRIGAWLKNLREKQYVNWIYSTDFIEKTKPAIYYLDLNGIRYLKTLDKYSASEVNKRYRESSRGEDFIARSLLVVDCAINLDEQNRTVEGLKYDFATQADYVEPDHPYDFMSDLAPDICYIKKVHTPAGLTTSNYLVSIFDATLPRYMVRKRLKDYVSYLHEGDLKQELESGELVVHIACPTVAELIYCKKRVRYLLQDIARGNDTHIRFSTIPKLKQLGMSGLIWEEV